MRKRHKECVTRISLYDKIYFLETDTVDATEYLSRNVSLKMTFFPKK